VQETLLAVGDDLWLRRTLAKDPTLLARANEVVE